MAFWPFNIISIRSLSAHDCDFIGTIEINRETASGIALRIRVKAGPWSAL